MTTIPGIREGQLQGGGTILGNGARAGPGQTTAIRRPWIGARGRRPLGRRPAAGPLGPYTAFNAVPSGGTPSRQKRHNTTSGFLAGATIITLRVRPPAAWVRRRNQAASALSGW